MRPVSAIPGLGVQDIRNGMEQLRKQERDGILYMGSHVIHGITIAEFCSRLVVGQRTKRLQRRLHKRQALDHPSE